MSQLLRHRQACAFTGGPGLCHSCSQSCEGCRRAPLQPADCRYGFCAVTPVIPAIRSRCACPLPAVAVVQVACILGHMCSASMWVRALCGRLCLCSRLCGAWCAAGANASLPDLRMKLFHSILYARVKGLAEKAVLDQVAHLLSFPDRRSTCRIVAILVSLPGCPGYLWDMHETPCGVVSLPRQLWWHALAPFALQQPD